MIPKSRPRSCRIRGLQYAFVMLSLILGGCPAKTVPVEPPAVTSTPAPDSAAVPAELSWDLGFLQLTFAQASALSQAEKKPLGEIAHQERYGQKGA